jgi:anti-anti-sigma factor
VLAVSRSRVPHPVLVMTVGGTLDADTRLAFVDYVAETLRTRRSTRTLILDLTDLAALSEGGLRAIHRTRRRLERHRVRVAIVAPPGGPVADALAPARVFDTRRAAIAATRSADRMSA